MYFHLDPLCSDANIDFVGIDNYLPLTGWRDGFDHADALEGSCQRQTVGFDMPARRMISTVP